MNCYNWIWNWVFESAAEKFYKLVLHNVSDLFGNVERRPTNSQVTQQIINQRWAKEVEEYYQCRMEEELQKTEKLIDKKRREVHVEIPWHYMRQDNGSSRSTILE